MRMENEELQEQNAAAFLIGFAAKGRCFNRFLGRKGFI
ncbi:hypothetical protein ELI_1669 [Eubacterium callanderi]|uniref:Uncharacterized protein n=1 Tax=Eubacterium callanderi TaxID=53442 RepID=E3GLN1_9FIRM|nr:hypothetical protein ELI_1669 [Eubacterium callanderi]